MGSPVDDALDRQLVPLTRAAAEAADADLQAEFMRLNPELQRRAALGVLEIDALRRQVEQLREERDAALESSDEYERQANRTLDRAVAAEAEADKYRKATDQQARRAEAAEEESEIERENAERAEAELQRYREGLRETADELASRRGMIDRTVAAEKFRALLADSPTDGGERHAEGLDERGIYGGRAYPDGGGAK